jgi:hypothetical protein
LKTGGLLEGLAESSTFETGTTRPALIASVAADLYGSDREGKRLSRLGDMPSKHGSIDPAKRAFVENAW